MPHVDARRHTATTRSLASLVVTFRKEEKMNAKQPYIAPALVERGRATERTETQSVITQHPEPVQMKFYPAAEL
jgi:hypothetical protein